MKKFFVPQLIAFVITTAISLMVYFGYFEYTNRYQPPMEVRFVTENIIKNSEGYIYEYEYVFNTDENTIFFHSDEKKSFETKEFILLLKDTKSESSDEDPTQNNFIFKYEFDKNINNYKTAFLVFFILEASILVLPTLVFLIIYIVKKIKNKQYILFEKIAYIQEHINYHYPCYRKIFPLLDKLSNLLKDLDLFYKKRKDSKIYKIKIRKRVESIVYLYAKNIDIDKKFEKNLIANKVHEDFYENLNQLISYVDSEISNLLKDNNNLISKEFDMLNSEAKLSGAAIEYLAEKYK